MKTTVNLSDEMNEKVEARMKTLGVSKTAIVSMAVERYFQEQDVINNLPELLKMFGDSSKFNKKTVSKG